MKMFTQLDHKISGLFHTASPKNKISQFGVTDPVLKNFVEKYEKQIPWSGMTPANKWTGKGEAQSQINTVAAGMFAGLASTIDPSNDTNTVYIRDIDINAEFQALAGHPQYGQIVSIYKSDPTKMKSKLISAVNSQKIENFQAWYKYLSENYQEKMAFAYMAMKSILDSSPSSRRDPPPVLDAKILADTYDRFASGNTGDIVKTYLTEYMSAAPGSKKKIEGNGWITIPSKFEDPENWNENLNYLMAVGSSAKWCVGNKEWASKYLSRGKFDIYLNDRFPRVAVRYEGQRPVELRGYANDDQALAPYWAIVSEYSKNTSDLSYLPKFKTIGEMERFSTLATSDPAGAVREISEAVSFEKTILMANIVADMKDVDEKIHSAVESKLRKHWILVFGAPSCDGMSIDLIDSKFFITMSDDFKKEVSDRALSHLVKNPSNYCLLNNYGKKALPPDALDIIVDAAVNYDKDGSAATELVDCQELWEHAKGKPYYPKLLQTTVERLSHKSYLDEDYAPLWLVNELSSKFDFDTYMCNEECDMDYEDLRISLAYVALTEYDDYTMDTDICGRDDTDDLVAAAMANKLASLHPADAMKVVAYVFHVDPFKRNCLLSAISLAAEKNGADNIAYSVMSSVSSKNVSLKFAVECLRDSGIRFNFKKISDLVRSALVKGVTTEGKEAVASLGLAEADSVLYDVLNQHDFEEVVPPERRNAAMRYIARPDEHHEPPGLRAANWFNRYVYAGCERNAATADI